MTARDPLVGQVLHSTYRVLRLISRGGMGVVYEAENVRLTNVRYAIKVLQPKWVQDRQNIDTNYARFQREAEIVSALHHPNIVTVLDYNKTAEGYPYLVMELLEGEDLDQRLKRSGAMAPHEVCALLEQVGNALQLAHDSGIVHRDLKPGNIFLVITPGGWQAKLLDFGISKDMESKHRVTIQEVVIIGTAAYMSPEQARGDIHEVDQTTDVFALATIAYRCLTGRRPFDGHNDSDVRFHVCYSEPPPLAELLTGVPPRLAAVLGRAHAKKKADRYGRVSQFVADFVHAFGREVAVLTVDPLDSARTRPIPRELLGQLSQTLPPLDEPSTTEPPPHARLTKTEPPLPVDEQPTTLDRSPTVRPAETTAPVRHRWRIWAALAGAALCAALVATAWWLSRPGEEGVRIAPRDQRAAAELDRAAAHRPPDAGVLVPDARSASKIPVRVGKKKRGEKRKSVEKKKKILIYDDV